MSAKRNAKVISFALPTHKYFFSERSTGVSHFHVESDAHGRFPVEHAAGLLAIHCLARGQEPTNYTVMIEASDFYLAAVTEKAQHFLDVRRAIKGHVKLTRREEEVLNGVMRSKSNKEIAASLNLSERTIKFHVSSLLAKFRVRGRMELVQEAQQHISNLVPLR